MGFETCSLLGFSQLTLRRASGFEHVSRTASSLAPNSTPPPPKKRGGVGIRKIMLKHFSWFLGAGPSCKTACDLIPMVVWSFGLGVCCLHALGLSHYQK